MFISLLYNVTFKLLPVTVPHWEINKDLILSKAKASLWVCTLNLICWASSLAPGSSAAGLLLGLRVWRAEHMEEPQPSQMKSWDLLRSTRSRFQIQKTHTRVVTVTRQTDRQRQASRQSDSQTDRETGTEKLAGRQADRLINANSSEGHRQVLDECLL